jgi:hypothetical protein
MRPGRGVVAFLLLCSCRGQTPLTQEPADESNPVGLEWKVVFPEKHAPLRFERFDGAFAFDTPAKKWRLREGDGSILNSDTPGSWQADQNRVSAVASSAVQKLSFEEMRVDRVLRSPGFVSILFHTPGPRWGVAAFAPEAMTESWTLELQRPGFPCDLLAADDRLLVKLEKPTFAWTGDTDVVCLAAADGSSLWRQTIPGVTYSVWTRDSDLVHLAGVVQKRDGSQRLDVVTLRLSDGTVEARVPVEDLNRHEDPSGGAGRPGELKDCSNLRPRMACAGGAVIFQYNRKCFHNPDQDSETIAAVSPVSGRVLWKQSFAAAAMQDFPHPKAEFENGPFVRGRRVWTVIPSEHYTGRYLLSAFDVDTGAAEFERRFGQEFKRAWVLSNAAIDSWGTMWILSEDRMLCYVEQGLLYCFRLPE